MLACSEHTLLGWNAMSCLSNLLKHGEAFQKGLATLRSAAIFVAPNATAYLIQIFERLGRQKCF